MPLCTNTFSVMAYLLQYSDHNEKEHKHPADIHLPLALSLRRPIPYKLPDESPAIKHANTKNTAKTPITTSSSSRQKKSTSSDIIRLMDSLGLPIPPDMYVSLIKECTLTSDSSTALELHAHLRHSGLRLTLPFINRLLLMYVSCGRLETARHLFDQMTVKKDFYSWAVLISGYVCSARYQEAIVLFIKMLHHMNFHISEFPASSCCRLIVYILKACGYTMNMELGTQVHALLLKLGSSSSSSTSVDHRHLGGSLIKFYGKLRCVKGANLVFDQLVQRNSAIWAAKIANECREGRFKEVMEDIKKMARARVRMNRSTLCSVLRACGRMEDGGNCGRQVHAQVIKQGLEWDVLVQCRLIDMYGKCGMMRDAKSVFHLQWQYQDEVHKRDNNISTSHNNVCTAHWNAMLMGYMQNGLYVDALRFVYQMKAAGIEVDISLLNEIRIACGSGSDADC